MHFLILFTYVSKTVKIAKSTQPTTYNIEHTYNHLQYMCTYFIYTLI